MTAAAEQTTVRRIIVTLGACDTGRATLETAARLATILPAELEGVFVEDINLIRLAELPFLRELRSWSLAEEALNGQRMQRELRAKARQAEQTLAQVAAARGVNWSFRVWRGLPLAESLLAALEADVLGLGRRDSLVSGRAQHISPPRARQATVACQCISVLFSGSEQATRALSTACRLAQDTGARLTVLLPEAETAKAVDLQERAAAILESHKLQARVIKLTETDAHSVARAVASVGDGILIAEVGHPLLEQGGLDQYLNALPCPILLMR
ncbi:MAG: universal stress protein [Gammaproteobacteria bacterium]|jgi:hypothetical protein